jgi:hypothetical protein
MHGALLYIVYTCSDILSGRASLVMGAARAIHVGGRREIYSSHDSPTLPGACLLPARRVSGACLVAYAMHAPDARACHALGMCEARARHVRGTRHAAWGDHYGPKYHSTSVWQVA